MINNRKFERAARSRRVFAFWVAVGLHLAVIAALMYRSELAGFMPAFITDFFTETTVSAPPAVP